MHNFYSIIIVLGLVWASAALSCGSDSGAATRLAEQMMLPEERKRDVQLLIHLIEQTLSTRWPDTRVALYGSMKSGLAHRHSDVDMYILPRPSPPAPPSLRQIRCILGQHPTLFSHFNMDCDGSLTEPGVLKFRHIPSGFKVDLTLKTFEGIVNSEFIGYLVGSGCERHLAMLLRHWGRLHGINGHGLLPSYGMALLVVFYLQHKHILPPVSELQKNAKPFFVDDWNMGFDRIVPESRNNESLYELLGGFFEFYEHFKFDENIVSTFVAHPVKRQLFRDLRTVPKVFSLYVHNVESNTTMPLDVGSSVCIQDPFQQNKNVGALLDASPGFRTQFQRAALKYRENDESAFLEHIFLENQLCSWELNYLV